MGGGAGYECFKVTLSDEWDRLHGDPLAPGQRYRTKFGVLTEIVDGKKAYYALAEFPPQGIQDAKFMAIEQSFKKRANPQELLDSLPKITPAAIGTVIMPTGRKGEYQLDRNYFKDLPKHKWFQLFNLTKL